LIQQSKEACTFHERRAALRTGSILVPTSGRYSTKAAVEPVWYLPGVAARFGIEEADLRRVLFEDTGGMYPELVTRPDIKVFLPPKKMA
jgi:hypothetical protein